MQPAREAIAALLADMKRVLPGLSGTLAKLETEIDRLSNEIVAFKYAGADPAIVDAKWYALGMTGLDTKFMAALERAGDAGCGNERLMAACYGDRVNDWPDPSILKVRVCNIRKKLLANKAPHHIQTIHGHGWVLQAGTGTPRLDKQGHVIWAKPDQLRLARQALKAA